jgi:Domain of unknown function (DUF3885)
MNLIPGPDWQNEFWVSPYSLRFELSDGECVGRYVTKFIHAFERARALARLALPGERVVGIIAGFSEPGLVAGAEWHEWTTGTAFDQLAVLGVPSDACLASWASYWWHCDVDDPEMDPWEQRAVLLTWEQADILLWNQVGQDLGIAPRAPVQAKLVDLERGICVDAYDDRGMDITALEKAPLEALYAERNDWLLDYDRARMAAVFEA